MRVLVIGGTGLIGGAVATALDARDHEGVRVGLDDGDLSADMADPSSLRALYQRAGTVDAVVCAAGVAAFGAFETLDDQAWASSIAGKLMGQVNLVRFGLEHVAEGGSFTLTTGTLSQRPTPDASAVAMVGGAVESFARAVALDLEGRYRVNVVSPGWVAEARQRVGLEPMPGIWAEDLAAYYVHCVEGEMTGEILEAESPLEADTGA